jgi:hypothetical protein
MEDIGGGERLLWRWIWFVMVVEMVVTAVEEKGRKRN